jgi:hypothetical protein
MYDLTLGQNGHFSKKKTNQKNHESFIPHVFSQNEHFSQVEPFEKP